VKTFDRKRDAENWLAAQHTAVVRGEQSTRAGPVARSPNSSRPGGRRGGRRSPRGAAPATSRS
jgi:hypothetical protein